MENFLPSTNQPPPSVVADRPFAPYVLVIELRGAIGSNASINVESARKQLQRAGAFHHLHVDITSSGGDANEAFGLYDLFRAQPVPVSARASVECLSAGMIVLMAADLRIAAAGTDFLVHPSSYGRHTLPERVTAELLHSQAKSLDHCDFRVAQLFADRTGFDLEWFMKEKRTEDLLSDVDAIETGLIHHFEGIIGPAKPGWPEAVKMRPPGVYLPDWMNSENYFAACRCAASLFGMENQSK